MVKNKGKSKDLPFFICTYQKKVLTLRCNRKAKRLRAVCSQGRGRVDSIIPFFIINKLLKFFLKKDDKIFGS